MIVAVTGATGFIGRRLAAAHLDSGDVVRVLSRRSSDRLFDQPGVTLFKGDLSIPSELPDGFVEGADVVYHCAGELRRADVMRQVHVEGTARLVDLVSVADVRFVHLSSVGVYGPRSSGTVTESTGFAPKGDYEVTKAEAEAVVTSRSDNYAILRPTIVYGSGMPNASVFGMISAIHSGRFAYIGRPGASANYVHVDDVVAALRLLATVPGASRLAFNVGEACELRVVVEAIALAIDRSPPSRRMPLPVAQLIAATAGRLPRFPLTSSRVEALTSRVRYSQSAIETVLGFSSAVASPDGLAALAAEWVRTSTL